MKLTQEQIEWVHLQVATWLGFSNVDASMAGAAHSSLLTRLLEGKEPTKYIPPLACSYPWYPLEDGERCPLDHSTGPEQSVRSDHHIVIAQTRYLKVDWDDATLTGLLQYELNGQKYRVTRDDSGVWFQKDLP